MAAIAEALRGARALIAKGWNPFFTRRAEGTRMVICDWHHPEAQEFSLDDAILRAANGDVGLVCDAEEFLRRLTIPVLDSATWSQRDGRTTAEVLAMLDMAIARAARMEAA